MQDNSIIKFDSKTKKFTRYEIPTENSRPTGLIFDKKNNYIWFAEALGKLAKIDVKAGYMLISKNTTISEDFSLSEPTALLLDQDLNIYISDHEDNSIVLSILLLSHLKDIRAITMDLPLAWFLIYIKIFGLQNMYLTF
jgi:hypothetical protein